MISNEQASRPDDMINHRILVPHHREHPEPRTIVIRHGTTWMSLAFLALCLLLLAVVVMGHKAVGELHTRSQDSDLTMARIERKMQQIESGLAFDSRRRQLLLGMRNRIMRTNPRVSLGDAYRYAELALEASEKYPAVDPLLLLAIGIVESGYDPNSRSPADARGLYQIWPSTGRLLLRADRKSVV